MPLFHPFSAGLLPLPAAAEHWLYVNAQPGFIVPEGFNARLNCVQGFRPAFLALERAGAQVSAELQPREDPFDGALVTLGRDRDENDLGIWQAAAALRPGDILLVAGGKQDGAASVKKRLAAAFPELGHVSKNHGIAMWFRRPDDRALENLLPCPQPALVDGFEIPPGGFSGDGPDEGSRLLARHFEGRLSGKIADFGVGWGWLAAQALQMSPAITALDCYEAHHASVQAARRNLSKWAGQAKLGFQWCDLMSEKTANGYDAVIMNPPFHAGRAAEPAIGAAFIAAAVRALKPGGRLLMVANRNLPYEKALAEQFRTVEKLEETSAFKVFAARK